MSFLLGLKAKLFALGGVILAVLGAFLRINYLKSKIAKKDADNAREQLKQAQKSYDAMYSVDVSKEVEDAVDNAKSNRTHFE